MNDCVDCGAVIEHKHRRGPKRIRCVQCSPEQLGQPSRYVKKSVPRESTCPQCRKRFTASFILVKYCCYQCRTDASNAKQRARWIASAKKRPPVKCQHCGVLFTRLYGTLHRLHCGEECARANVNASKTGGTHRRRARRFGVEYTPISRIIVFERDDWTCQLCGIGTPRDLMGKRVPAAPELDHAVPLSRGGAHSYENTQCLCRSCNLVKAARTMEEARELLAA